MENRKINILKYDEAYKCGVQNIGGKAYSIARLNDNNINVPKGVILSKDIWKHYEKTRDEKFFQNISNEIDSYLNSASYVVRSSAIGEDSKEFSWAGCFESILDVKSSNLKSAIIECGNSLYGDRAKIYEQLHKNACKIESIGILIQEYIDAEWSGVCFSCNPVTGNEGECVIEYQKGKSGSVVGGYGEPTTLIINKDDENYDGTMPLKYINLILKNVKRISKIWNEPVDIEWVVKNGKVYITQARPITTI